MSNVKIAVIVAGNNEPSNANVLANAFIEGVKSSGAIVEKIRLKDRALPHFTLACYDGTCAEDAGCSEFRKLIQEADGVLIASPIWNFSVPAHLKNFIDCMGAYGLDGETHSQGTFGGKPFYLLYTGGTPLTAWPLMKRTTSHMNAALAYFGASVVGTHFEPRCTRGRGVFGLVVDQRPESLELVREKAKAFVLLVKNFKETGSLPLKYRILRWMVAQAQRVKRMLGL